MFRNLQIKKKPSERVVFILYLNFGTNIKIPQLSQVIGNDRNGYPISGYIENTADGNSVGKRVFPR